MNKILIVDDEGSIRKGIRLSLKALECEILEAGCMQDAFEIIKKGRDVDIVLTDMQMPCYPQGELDEKCGLKLIKRIRDISNCLILVMTAYGSIENAIEAIKVGAFDYLTKPFTMEEIRIKIEKAFDQLRIVDENKFLRGQMKDYTGTIIGRSKGIKEIWKAIHSIAGIAVPVLIRGESGTGKELVARAIHENSSRADRVFMPVNLSALPESLIESELFGHEKGAFTNAFTQRAGKFEAANGGTLFLDEIGEIDLNLQVKLLRVLQEQSFERIGQNTPIKTDVRIIAATNADLEEKMGKGLFRQDLFFRLNVFPINILPLRERKEDISELVSYFIKKHGSRIPGGFEGITTEALKALLAYDWIGNVRELENIVQRMMIRGKGRYLDAVDIPAEIMPTSSSGHLERVINTLFDACKGESIWTTMQSTLARLALQRVQTKDEAARLLGISKPTLYSWLR